MRRQQIQSEKQSKGSEQTLLKKENYYKKSIESIGQYININIPKPKRGIKQKPKQIFDKNQAFTKNSKNNHIIKGFQSCQTNKIQNNSKQQNKLNSNPTNKKQNVHSKKIKKSPVGQILSYFLAESQLSQGQVVEESMRTVYQWENREIQKMTRDPNLGDFLIKLPNPDHMAQQYIQLFAQVQNQQKIVQISYQQAFIFYNDMFNVNGASKRRVKNQQFSFLLAFYFLNFQETRSNSQNKFKSLYNQNESFIAQNIYEMYLLEANIFFKVFKYYLMIQQLEFPDYKLKQDLFKQQFGNCLKLVNQLQQNLQKVLEVNYKKSIIQTKLGQNYHKHSSYDVLRKEVRIQQIDSTQSFYHHKNQIFQHFLSSYINYISNRLVEWGAKQAQKIKSQIIFMQIFNKCSIISIFFSYFLLNGAKDFIQFINLELSQKHNQSSNIYKRKVCRGENLKKILKGQNKIWVNMKDKPKDLYTLLRNCLVYQLTQNCHFRVRSFISKKDSQIILIVKAFEEVLQYYAQKNSIQMEVQLGATDIFSFQPVDYYLRPLRLHQYIRDQSFIKKYSLKTNKMDKDEPYDSKSIESDALNLFKKAQKMNADQLRAKIILDQEDGDDCIKWISEKLSVKYINDTNILKNQHNKKQVSRESWQCYYIYNKLMIHFTKRLMSVYSKDTDNLKQLNDNIGLILRLMFLKAMSMCNQYYYNHRESRNILPNYVKNLFQSKSKLKSLWQRVGVTHPNGFYQYVKNSRLEKIWRKYQVNQMKDRSKFFPAERIWITNKIIKKYVNLSQSIQKMHIIDYFPLHDPFILKNIKIDPYLINLKSKINNFKQDQQLAQSRLVKNMYVQYSSSHTSSDFTKLSIKDRLSIFTSIFKKFSVNSIRYYCGQKIAFYFQFVKYLTSKSFPIILIALIIQIILWVEQSHVLQKGSSSLRYFNNFLVFLITVGNMFWTTDTVERWKFEEKTLAHKYGVTHNKETHQNRVRFNGKFKTNFQTDQINDQYVSTWRTFLKSVFTFAINLLYVGFVCALIVQIFVLKSILFQTGYSQNVVNIIPSVLIAITVQVFSLAYKYLIKLIIQFQNHKTLSSFQSSLISKSYIITFVITFISIIIYGFFSQYLESSYLCIIKTSVTKQTIYNCDYFVSSQLLSLVFIDLIFTIINGILPYVRFRINDYFHHKNNNLQFFYNKFESIDQFYQVISFLFLDYQEQDQMHTYMFNDQIDNTWTAYMNIITVFTALALFGPALPFVYVLLFISGVVKLHSSKYQIIFLSKRSIPIKANSINSWLKIIQIIGIVSIFTNIAYMIYTRQVFSSNKSQIFFFFLIVFFILKYYLVLQYKKKQSMMGERNKLKVTSLVHKKSFESTQNIPQTVNTDILNVIYDEKIIKRVLPKIKKANVVTKKTHTTNYNTQ